MFAEELRGCPQLATVHTHFFRAEWLSQGSAVRTSKMATASSLDVSAPTCFSFGEDRLGTILSASTPGSVESTRELFKDLLSPSASTLMSTRLQAFSQGALRFCWVASYLSCSYFMVTINPTTRTKRDGDKRFRKTCVRERFKESHVVFGLPPSSHFVVCLCVRAFVCPRGRSHFNMFHDAECRFNVPLGFGKACSCGSFAKSHGVGGAVRTSSRALGHGATEWLDRAICSFFIAAGSVDPASSKS